VEGLGPAKWQNAADCGRSLHGDVVMVGRVIRMIIFV
jgi:hypothetical protein